MADETNNPETNNGAAEQQTGPALGLQKVYVKDVSFESPSAPDVFREPSQPELKLNLGQRVNALGDDLYEVTLSVTVTCKFGEKTAYLVEVQQAGIFQVAGFAEDQLNAALGAYCPNVLFPYARQQVSDLVLAGGFPPLLLQPVNFDQLYAEQLRRRAEQATEEA